MGQQVSILLANSAQRLRSRCSLSLQSLGISRSVKLILSPICTLEQNTGSGTGLGLFGVGLGFGLSLSPASTLGLLAFLGDLAGVFLGFDHGVDSFADCLRDWLHSIRQR